MEKSNDENLMNIFITGSESTGKSTLARKLSEHFGVAYVPEFAREYIASLNRPYNIADLELIAKRQINQIRQNSSKDLVFFDTGLIITYVWFEYKYQQIPGWLVETISVYGKGKYLLCEPDIPWEHDPVRENPDIRHELNARYQELITSLGFEWNLVTGDGEKRINNAIQTVDSWASWKEAK